MVVRWAVTVWVAWLSWLGLAGVQVAGQVRNPSPILAVRLMVLIPLGLAGLVISAGYRLIRGPGWRRALAWLLFGATPGWLFLGHVLLAVRSGLDRHARASFATKVLVPLARPCFDLEARWFYPERTQGRWVTMVGAPVATAAAQVAAMDRHVDALLARLHQARTWPIVWYRGSLFGMGGHAIENMALGVEEGQLKPGSDGLTSVDRHEVAHAAIAALQSPTTEPPTVLVEGWAQANMGTSPEELARVAWDTRQQGRSLTLRQLIADDWYWYSGPAAYDQGAPLVNYLLQTYGPERFLTLFATCGPATFEADLQRTLGVGLDALDAAYWADVERLAIPAGSPPEHWFQGLTLAPEIAPDTWKSFLTAYFTTALEVVAPYEQARLTFRSQNGTDADRAQPWFFEERGESLRSGPLARLRLWSNWYEFAGLAHPDHSMYASRQLKPKAEPWMTPETDSQVTPEQLYRRTLSVIRSRASRAGFLTTHGAALLEFPAILRDYGIPDNLAVTEFQTTTQEGHPLVSLNLRASSPGPGVKSDGFRFVLDPEDGYRARSIHSQISGRIADTICHYDRPDGHSRLRSLVTMYNRDGQPQTDRLEVEVCQFGPIAESEFALEPFLASLGPGPLVREPADQPSTATHLDWYWLAFVGGGMSLAGGLAFLAQDRRGEPG